MRRNLRIGLCMVLLGLAGCTATSSPRPSNGDNYRELYEGKPTTVFATQFPITSVEEAIKRGDEALRRGDSDRALFEYLRGLELDRSSHEVLYKIGSIHAARGNRRLAEIAFRWTLKLASDHAGALEGLGLLLLEKRQYDDAERLLARAVEADPERWRAHNGLGVMADLRKDYDKAITHYWAALTIQPDSSRILNNIGYSHYLSGLWDEALRVFKKAVIAHPQNERAWMNLGLLYTRRGKYHDALAAFRRVMDEPAAYNNLGYVCMLDGNYKLAATFLGEAMQRSPIYYVTANDNLQKLSRYQNK